MSPLEASEDLIRKIVKSASFSGGQPVTEARKCERVIPHHPDVVLGLPHPPTLDASVRVEGVDDAPSKDVRRCSGGGDEKVPNTGA